MELHLKLTDVKESQDKDKPTKVSEVLDEALVTVNESLKKIQTLADKGRKKIDLVGELCNVEITIK